MDAPSGEDSNIASQSSINPPLVFKSVKNCLLINTRPKKQGMCLILYADA